jgi:catechol 2,3-dioxygenase-like lactoylglutathione lyase family enzyme
MITAVHLLIYSDDAAATRAFLRDVLGWPFVEHAESAPGWLIFRSGPSELGVHPTSGTYEGHAFSHPRHHSVSLMCDDIGATIAELEAKGAQFTGPPEDLDFGVGTSMKVPGADDILVYEPKHPEAYSL